MENYCSKFPVEIEIFLQDIKKFFTNAFKNNLKENIIKEEQTKKEKKPGVEKTQTSVRAMRSIVLDLLIILAVFVISLLIYKEINRETVIIEPFQVPSDLEKQNITGQAIVNKLVDQIEIIKTNADTAYKKLDVRPVIYDTQLEFVIPVTGISLKSLLQNLKNFLGKKQTRISGEVVMDGKQLNLTIRVYGEPSKTFTGELNNLDNIMKDAAQYVLQYTQPYLLAYYLYYYYEKKDKEAATEMIHYALTHPPKDDDAMAYTLEGFILYDEERYDDAVKRFKKAIELDPDCVDAYNNWAYILNEQKKSDSAINLYKKSVEIDPNYFYTYHYWGIALADQGKYDEAFKMFDKAIQLDPRYVDVYEDYGKTLAKLQRYDEAMEMFNKAIEVEPKSPLVYIFAGNALYEQKKFLEAEEFYKKAIKLDSSSKDAFIGLSDALFEQQKFPEAVSAYRKVIRITPADIQSHRKLALSLEQQNKTDDAVLIYKKLITLAPADSIYFAEKIFELKNP